MPLVGSANRFSRRSSVDLPAPDGPTSAVHAPGGISQVTASSSTAVPRCTVTLSSANTGELLGCIGVPTSNC